MILSFYPVLRLDLLSRQIWMKKLKCRRFGWHFFSGKSVLIGVEISCDSVTMRSQLSQLFRMRAVMACHTISEAASITGVNRRTIYRYIKSGKLSASVTSDNKTVIDTSELLGYLVSCHNLKQQNVPLDHKKTPLNMSQKYWLKCHKCVQRLSV